MVDQLIQNPADNLRRWHGTACACTRCCEARRADFLARIKAEVQSGAYPDTGEKYDAAYARMETRAAEQVTESARIDWDRKNTADQFE